MRITSEWISASAVQSALRLLKDAGYAALLVGGCVRNAILQVPVADIDIATDARPDEVMRLAAAAGFRAVPTGIEHGTITVVVAGAAFEVTTFRQDVETDGRRAVVVFADDVAADASRRDLTMNALYADAQGEIVDPLGGLPDLLARRVRFVGNASERIREDYLRILRFFRFHAHYGDPEQGLDPEGLDACSRNSAGIDTLSRERVGHEMRRLLAAPDPAPALAAMAATGVLARTLPGADPRGIAPLVHIEAGAAPSWPRRLAILGGEDPVQALRLSRHEAKALAARRAGIGSGAGAGELGYRLGAEAARDVLMLRAALMGSSLPAGWDRAVAKGAGARLPVRAEDLAGALVGPALGRKLREIEAKWIASDFELSREQLLA